MIHEINCYHCGRTHRFTSNSLYGEEGKYWKKHCEHAEIVAEEIYEDKKQLHVKLIKSEARGNKWMSVAKELHLHIRMDDILRDGPGLMNRFKALIDAESSASAGETSHG